MAKVSIKSEKITLLRGILHVREHFPGFVGPVIDKVLGLWCTSYRTIELIRVMPFGEVNHKINIAILKILLIKELFICSFARLFEFTGGLYFLRSVQFTFSL